MNKKLIGINKEYLLSLFNKYKTHRGRGLDMSEYENLINEILLLHKLEKATLELQILKGDNYELCKDYGIKYEAIENE